MRNHRWINRDEEVLDRAKWKYKEMKGKFNS